MQQVQNDVIERVANFFEYHNANTGTSNTDYVKHMLAAMYPLAHLPESPFKRQCTAIFDPSLPNAIINILKNAMENPLGTISNKPEDLVKGIIIIHHHKNRL